MTNKEAEEMNKMMTALPEKAIEPYFRALLTVASEGKILGTFKKITNLIAHVVSWMFFGVAIAGGAWLITFLLVSIRGMV